MEANSPTEHELREDLKEKRKELSVLRSQVRLVHEQKEAHYQQLLSIKNSIKSCLDQIRSLKGERDQLTNIVKELKQQRNTFNILTKEKVTRKEEASKKKEELIGKIESTENPHEIRFLIRKLEHRLETEVMPFPKEEKLRKQVKEMQVRLKKMSELEEVWKTSNATAAEAAEVRRQAGHMHQEMQKAAGQSQQKHELVNSLYGKLKELRGQEKPITEKYVELKNEAEQLRKKIQELQSQVQELSKLFTDKEEKSFHEQIKEKTAQVSEKIKKREKLKIEDILAYQASDED